MPVTGGLRSESLEAWPQSRHYDLVAARSLRRRLVRRSGLRLGAHAARRAMSRVDEQFEHASRFLAGGVSSSTRVNQALGRPMYFERAAGCRVWDLDGGELIDLCCSHGATLLGHGD